MSDPIRFVNPLSWVADGLKVWPEPPSGPDWLDEMSPMVLAEARNRLQMISQVATELRKLVDSQLVATLNGAALRYGDTILRENQSHGRVFVKDIPAWWETVVRGLKATPNPEGLLGVLYPPSALRLTGLKMLAEAVAEDAAELRAAHIGHELPTSPLSAMPISKAPKFLQRLEEGQTSYDRKAPE